MIRPRNAHLHALGEIAELLAATLTRFRALAWTLVPLAIAACSSSSSPSSSSSKGPTIDEAARRIAPTLCAALDHCDAAAFASAYTDVSTCTDRTIANVERGSDPSSPSGCTSAELDACAKAIPAAACPADVSKYTLPAACSGC